MLKMLKNASKWLKKTPKNWLFGRQSVVSHIPPPRSLAMTPSPTPSPAWNTIKGPASQAFFIRSTERARVHVVV